MSIHFSLFHSVVPRMLIRGFTVLQGRQLLEREFNNLIAMGTERRLGEEVSSAVQSST